MVPWRNGRVELRRTFAMFLGGPLVQPFSINGDLLQKAFLLYVFVGVCSGIGVSYEFNPGHCLYLLRKGLELAPGPRGKRKTLTD